MLAEEIAFVPATVEQLATLHATLERFWRTVEQVLADPPGLEWRMLFETGVIEVGNNIVRYAYADAPVPGTLELRLRVYADRVEAHFTDRGSAYVAPAEPVSLPLVSEFDIPEGGYGLALVRASVDQFTYDRIPDGRNYWQLLKRFGG